MGNRLSKIYTRTGDDGLRCLPSAAALPARLPTLPAKNVVFAGLRRSPAVADERVRNLPVPPSCRRESRCHG